MIIYDWMKKIANRIRKPKCDDNCWHYGTFGWKGGCNARDSYGGMHEPHEPGQACLHPDKKEFGRDLGVVSATGLCAALRGAVIVRGKDDNTKLVQALTGSSSEKPPRK